MSNAAEQHQHDDRRSLRASNRVFDAADGILDIAFHDLRGSDHPTAIRGVFLSEVWAKGRVHRKPGELL